MKMRVSLSELDRWFEYILAGKPYHGEAINPKNLSLFENLIGVGKVHLPSGCAPDFKTHLDSC